MQRSTPNTLNALATPDLGLLAEVIRSLDQDGLPDAAFRSGVRSFIDERLPPPPSPLDVDDWPAGYLLPGTTPAGVAAMIYGLLSWNADPATRVLSGLAGRAGLPPVTIEIGRAATRQLGQVIRDRVTEGDAAAAKLPARLAADPDARCYEREGIMMAGKVTVGPVRLLVLEDRTPPAAWDAILGGEPAGAVLEPYGMRRTHRKVAVARADVTVDSMAVLQLGNLAMGTAEEHIGHRFCEHVAAQAG